MRSPLNSTYSNVYAGTRGKAGQILRDGKELRWILQPTLPTYLPTCLGFSWLFPVVVVVGFFFFVFLSFLVYPDVL